MGDITSYAGLIAIIVMAILRSIVVAFNKEQDKAKNRNPSIPVEQNPTPQQKNSKPVEGDWDPFKELFPIPIPTESPKRSNPQPKPQAEQRRELRKDVKRTLKKDVKKSFPSTPRKNWDETYNPSLEREKTVYKSLKEERKQDLKRHVEIPEEVLRLREYKELKKRESEKFASKYAKSSGSNLSKSIELDLMEENSNTTEKLNFNLREAVLYSTILERKHF